MFSHQTRNGPITTQNVTSGQSNLSRGSIAAAHRSSFTSIFATRRHVHAHLIHDSMCVHETATQTSSRSVYPFSQGPPVCLTHMTDHGTCDICSHRPHLFNLCPQRPSTHNLAYGILGLVGHVTLYKNIGRHLHLLNIQQRYSSQQQFR